MTTVAAWSTREEALARHRAVTVELMDLHRELAQLLAAEKEAKVRAYAQAQGTDKNREQTASFNALNLTTDIFKLKGEIEAWNALRDDIRIWLAYT